MHRFVRRAFLATLLVLAAPATLLAQGNPPPAGAGPRMGGGGFGGAMNPRGTVGTLADQPDLLALDATQRARATQLAAWLERANAPLLQQMQQATGGRPMQELTPEERRGMMGQLMPVLQQMQANNATALDSLRLALTPVQQQRLDSLRAAQAPGGGRMVRP